MRKLLVDNDIIIDLLAERHPFATDAQQLFTHAEGHRIQLYVSALTFANTHYLLSRQLSRTKTRQVLRQLSSLVSVIALDTRLLDLALESEFGDFEDAIQYYSAVSVSADVIITRNHSDFKFSSIPVMSAKEYLAQPN